MVRKKCSLAGFDAVANDKNYINDIVIVEDNKDVKIDDDDNKDIDVNTNEIYNDNSNDEPNVIVKDNVDDVFNQVLTPKKKNDKSTSSSNSK